MKVITLTIPDEIITAKQYYSIDADTALQMEGNVNGKSGLFKVTNETANDYTLSLPIGHYVEENLASTLTVKAGDYVELSWVTDNDTTDWLYGFFVEIT